MKTDADQEQQQDQEDESKSSGSSQAGKTSFFGRIGLYIGQLFSKRKKATQEQSAPDRKPKKDVQQEDLASIHDVLRKKRDENWKKERNEYGDALDRQAEANKKLEEKIASYLNRDDIPKESRQALEELMEQLKDSAAKLSLARSNLPKENINNHEHFKKPRAFNALARDSMGLRKAARTALEETKLQVQLVSPAAAQGVDPTPKPNNDDPDDGPSSTPAPAPASPDAEKAEVADSDNLKGDLPGLGNLMQTIAKKHQEITEGVSEATEQAVDVKAEANNDDNQPQDLDHSRLDKTIQEQLSKQAQKPPASRKSSSLAMMGP